MAPEILALPTFLTLVRIFDVPQMARVSKDVANERGERTGSKVSVAVASAREGTWEGGQ